ncbi:MAG TPA: radical SAM family heme chaperone HemW [Bacteroidota bacterium]|nr:radical SAM family heme chaperone HemW [Bacteroidota bacterium]
MGSLYLHIPYCEKKCLYCDFYSIENMESMERFLGALEKEITEAGAEYAGKESFETIFFGGGTPSLLAPSALERILLRLHSSFRIDPDAEVTVETNPGTADLEKLRAYRSLGVNRLSIGIQSFHPDELKFLSRIHTAGEAADCVENAYRAGFENLNVDLIFSLPKQTLDRWKENLQRAAALQPKHISAYSLIVEEHTPLYAMVQEGRVKPLSEKRDSAMYETTLEMMANFGFEQYEVSNFARPGFSCRHNKNYWNHSNYLGFGPSAHSFWKDRQTGGRRWWNARSIAQYCDAVQKGASAAAGSEVVDKEKMFSEAVFLGLRTGELSVTTLQQLYGIDMLEARGEKLKLYSDEQLLRIDNRRIALTRKGFMVCDAIAESLL